MALTFAVEPVVHREAVETLWRRLEAEADGHFFTSWTWIGAWLRHVERPVYLLRAEEAGEPVALGLFCVHRQVRWKVLPVTTLQLAATGDDAFDLITVEYNDLLVRADGAEAIRAAVWRWLGGRDRFADVVFDEIHLPGVTAATGRAAATASGLAGRVYARKPLALVDLQAVRACGRPWPEMLGSNTRYQLRRALRLYGERGEPLLEAAADVPTALEWLEQAGELHQRRWTAKGRSGAFASPFFVAFARELVRLGVPEGTVEMLRIRAGSHVIGYLQNFVYRGHAFYYFGGFAYEEDPRIKPGLVAHHLAVLRYLERGCQIYDFGAGAFRYKYQLGQPGPDIETWILRRPRVALELEDLARRLRARWRARRQRAEG
ncbi:hypothetical protein HRbin40_00260 [bacterium HR40]|nr:hypothetical protein HRbin40_00260 [bacterium HR40]